MESRLAPDPLLKNVPPHSLEAERAVLGAVLIDSRAVDDVAEEVGADDFYSGAHATIFGLILELWQKNEPVDVVLLNEELARRGVLDQVGGTAALAELCEVLPDITRFGVMKHLRVLEDARLVVSERAGRAKLHHLNPVPIREIHDRWISHYAEPFVTGLLALRDRVEGA